MINKISPPPIKILFLSLLFFYFFILYPIQFKSNSQLSLNCHLSLNSLSTLTSAEIHHPFTVASPPPKLTSHPFFFSFFFHSSPARSPALCYQPISPLPPTLDGLWCGWFGGWVPCLVAFFFLLWVVVVMVIVVADGGGHCGWLLRIVVDVFIIVLMSYLCYFNQIAKNINH